jgi:hypothetical protein
MIARDACPAEHLNCLLHNDPRHFGDPDNIYNPGGELGATFDELAPLVEDLDDVVVGLHAMARGLQKLAKRGWVLSDSTRGGRISLCWAGDGAPPAEDSQQINGLTAGQQIAANNSA